MGYCAKQKSLPESSQHSQKSFNERLVLSQYYTHEFAPLLEGWKNIKV